MLKKICLSIILNGRNYCQSTVIKSRPLEGIRILDMTRIVAGPYCSMILADMGADVIKVEKPNTGDESRRFGPPFADIPEYGLLSLYFIALNRNKRSMSLDFQTPTGKKILCQLVETSHVFIENYVPGTLDKYGLGYENLRKINEKLIYCSISGYGTKGPWCKKPGYDIIAASLGGLLNATGKVEPVKVAVPVTDLMTGMYAHGAILAALHRGLGDKIECDLMSTQLSMMINLGSNYLNSGIQTKRWGTEHESIVPYKAFKTLDGFFTLGAGSDCQFKSFCELIHRPELAKDERFMTNVSRVKYRDQLYRIIEPILASKTNCEWTNTFNGAPFPCGSAFNNEHSKAINIVQEIDCTYNIKLKLVGPAVTFQNTSNKIIREPPLLGQHTDEILKSLGLDVNEISKLRTEGVV
ncbi:succinate--hydroxymethylglutarate CoA-transferase isoform X2 [Daktulosphaira vitifoliae]|uniref:succinate--hydroxymethylglutarate CoA-transferase isoform X2 n=1 Tax=Daktulosphaira vitifoliae TaxID=58002 RepID=UPI0021A9F15C|nr:succinate--hydroxymethylglutarate CoA-transferase isoform X2 [Daktulosphaira vitifoliae]